MATVDQAFRQRLVDTAGVSALVGTKIFQNFANAATTLPCIVFQVVSDVPYRNISYSAGLSVARIQLDIYAETIAEEHAIREAVRASLDSYVGTIAVAGSGTLRITQVRRETTRPLQVPAEVGRESHYAASTTDWIVSYPETIITH